MSIFLILDYVGTLVFAISGALAAINRKFDPFGVAILAVKKQWALPKPYK